MKMQNDGALDSAVKHRMRDGSVMPCHVVDVIAGGEDQLLVAPLPSGPFVVVSKEMVDIGGGELEKQDVQRKFFHPFELLEWLKAEGLTVPRTFLDRLNSGFLGNDARAWRATIEDVARLANREYVVHWSLSHEDPETQNCETVDSVALAFEILGREGAMQALPGNSGSVWLGSIELYSTHFSSSGIDRGDSHVNPTTKTVEGSLLEQIKAFEERSAFDHEVRTNHVSEFISQAGGGLWGEHPDYPKSDWKYEVKHGDTVLGYWEWAYQKHHDR